MMSLKRPWSDFQWLAKEYERKFGIREHRHSQEIGRQGGGKKPVTWNKRVRHRKDQVEDWEEEEISNRRE